MVRTVIVCATLSIAAAPRIAGRAFYPRLIQKGTEAIPEAMVIRQPVTRTICIPENLEASFSCKSLVTRSGWLQ